MGAPQYEQAGADVAGSGTTNTIPRWTGPSTLGDSGLIDNGTAIYTTTRNVGIGVIPSAWASSVRAEEMRTHARWNYNSGSDSVAYWTVNAFLNSAGNAIYKATAAASQYTQIGGAHVWERAVSGTAGNTVTWLESARIDSSGNVGIGTASPAHKLQVAGGFIATSPGYGVYQPGDHLALNAGAGKNVHLKPNDGGLLAVNVGATLCDLTGVANYGLKLAAAPGNADTQTLDCYAETDVNTGYTLFGVTTTSGAITVAIRATRIGRTMTFAVSIAPAGGASLTFAAGWYLTMTGISAPAFAGSLAVSSNDAVINRGSAWVNAVAGPTVYGSAAALGPNVSLFLNGTI